MTASTIQLQESGTVRAAGADLYYELCGSGPVVVLHAAPMDAESFAPAAELLVRDHAVVTMDPRGINRSRVDDREVDLSPDDRADDVAAVLDHLGVRASVLFGSSGGAVSALAVAQRRPDLVDIVVAHEPPLAHLVDDTDRLRTETEEMVRTHVGGDRAEAWRLFMDSADIDLPDEVFDAVFGHELSGQQAADEEFSFAHMELPTTFWMPDLDVLRQGPVDLFVGIGEESAGELCDRTSRVLAAELGIEPVMFPGGHVGFTQDPKAFAERLVDVVRAEP